MNLTLFKRRNVQCVLYGFLGMFFLWLIFFPGSLAHAETLPTPSLTPSSTTWTNQDVSVSANFTTGTKHLIRLGNFSLDKEDTSNGGIFVRGNAISQGPSLHRQLIINGKTIYDEGDDNNGDVTKIRGFRLTVLDSSSLKILFDHNYDVYHDGQDPDWQQNHQDMTNKLNSLDSNVIVVIASYDAGNAYGDLATAMERCGATGPVGVTDDESLNGYWYLNRVPYVLIGVPGIGKGNGIEVRQAVNDANAPAAQATAKFKNGMLNGLWTYYKTPISLAENNTVYAKTEDDSGNSSSMSSYDVNFIDKVTPLLDANGNPATGTHHTATLNATASDDKSGVKRIQTPDGIWHDGGSVSYKISKNGNYNFIAEDNAGNQTTQTLNVTNMLDELWMSKHPDASLKLNPVTLTGTKQTIKFSGPSLNLEDNRETGQGWHISVSASPFTDSKNHILPAGSFQMKAPSITGTDSTPSSSVTAYQAIDLGSSVDIVKANTGQGEGAYSVNMNDLDAMQASIPANTYAGSYQSNILWQISSAP